MQHGKSSAPSQGLLERRPCRVRLGSLIASLRLRAELLPVRPVPRAPSAFEEPLRCDCSMLPIWPPSSLMLLGSSSHPARKEDDGVHHRAGQISVLQMTIAALSFVSPCCERLRLTSCLTPLANIHRLLLIWGQGSTWGAAPASARLLALPSAPVKELAQ